MEKVLPGERLMGTGTSTTGPGERDEGHEVPQPTAPHHRSPGPPGTRRGLSAAFVQRLRSGVATKAEVKGVNSGDRGRM